MCHLACSYWGMNYILMRGCMGTGIDVQLSQYYLFDIESEHWPKLSYAVEDIRR